MTPCSTASRAFCWIGTCGFGLSRRVWSVALVFALAAAAAFILQPTTVRFEFMGVDWDKVPNGYHGVLPEKLYMILEIPRKYLDKSVVPFLFWSSISSNIGLSGPSIKRRSSILIHVYYPSMRADPIDSSEERVGVILGATEGRRVASKEQILHVHDGVIRDPHSDQAGLCGYVDPVHVGWEGHEFYLPCESRQNFFIDCDQPYGDRRSCIEYVFFGRGIDAMLFFQYRILQDHEAIVEAVKELVFSFVRSIRDTHAGKP